MTIGSRKPFVGGNWKMNMTRSEGIELATGVASGIGDLTDTVDVAVFPAFPYLDAVGSAISGSAMLLGSQDVYHQPSGAFTGEVSADMLLDCGVSAVLAGHSERRHVIGEDDRAVNRKVRASIAGGMTSVLCVGETLEQREAGETDAVNERQTRLGLAEVEAGDLDKVVIAYEPVWAIGTGRTATPEDAQDAHASIRGVIADLYGETPAGSIRIIYGGSMKPANAEALMAMPDIDGGLIGGASLVASDFGAIVRAGAALAR
ncbi:MAG: triose-phosphate isomerase [Planctomycetota bacterium]